MSHSRATSITAYSARGGLLETPDRLVPLSLQALDAIAFGLRGTDQVTASRELKQRGPRRRRRRLASHVGAVRRPQDCHGNDQRFSGDPTGLLLHRPQAEGVRLLFA